MVNAARSAPFFPAGLRDNLTAAAEFASAMADRVADYDAAVNSLTQANVQLNVAVQGLLAQNARAESDFAELLVKLTEIEARLPEA
ncbi:hypothetical protein CDN99_25550 [Roseateles aquatilis]|uniref:Uncharacterized protein n=1 Tax=Roseateles aquatilis TaxID=431061 RepID=A0A246IUF0_9BURK|nr:hypothetical protein [Roseateles aquatilis]OWQ83834.1 hypothetical protein CDN99_25550 [Roseateles aquatilis]